MVVLSLKIIREGSMTRRWLALLTAALVACAVVVQVPASAASLTTPLLGNTSVPRIPRAGIAASTPCPSGAFVVGARVWLDTFPRVTGVAAFCTSSTGTTTLGVVAGDTSDAVAVGDSVCNGTDLAVGLKAANGEVINAVAVRCQGVAGTYDAAVIGNQTTIKSNADCDSGTALTGIRDWYNIYGGPHNNVYGVQGACAPIDTTPPVTTVAADRSPDSNGWYNHPFTATWSTPEPNVTCTTTTYSGPDTAAGSLSGTCTDAARNVSAPVVFHFKYDATAPTVATAPFTYVTLGSSGFRIGAHDNLSGVAAVQVTLHPYVGVGGPLMRNATCVAGCGTTNSQWYVSTAGAAGIFRVTSRATDVAGNISAQQ